jgi:hypothetical protein
MGVPIGQANLYGAISCAPARSSARDRNRQLAQARRAHSGRPWPLHEPARDAGPRRVGAGLASTDGTATILVSGWDVWGQAMTELLTAAGTTPVYGKKAFKYVQSVVPQAVGTTVSATYTIGISDVFGFPFRTDQPNI